MFGTYNIKADRLTVLKTSFPEELILTGRAPPTAPKVISLVAFRWGDEQQLLCESNVGAALAPPHHGQHDSRY